MPTWIIHKDGRRVPFDADRISRALFQATEALGQANAFLTRELTDGVLHFLTQEALGETATTEQIDDVAIKVIRELGQPELARIYAEHASAAALPKNSSKNERETLAIPFLTQDAPGEVANRSLEVFSLRAVFSPDIAAAHEEGLLSLGGLQSPGLLNRALAEPIDSTPQDPFELGCNLVAESAKRAGGDIVIDGAEWLLVDASPNAVTAFLRGIERMAQAFGHHVWMHLHASSPPTWAKPQGVGPLFGEGFSGASASSKTWLQALCQASAWLRPVWHYRGGHDADAAFLETLASSSPASWSVIFDRPHRPVVLGLGLDRHRPAVLLDVELDVPSLLNRPEVGCQGDVLLDKLPSLTRMAVRAGVQKRAYLRRHAQHLGRAFLLDRAAVRLVPRGVDQATRQLLGTDVTTSKLSLNLGRKILASLERPLKDERRRSGLDLVLSVPPEARSFVGSPHETLQAIHDWQRGLVEGLVPVLLPESRTTEVLRECLDFAWQKTEIAGLSLAHPEVPRIAF